MGIRSIPSDLMRESQCNTGIDLDGLARTRPILSCGCPGLRRPIPFPNQDCSGRKFGPLLIEADQPRRHSHTGFLRTDRIQQLPRLMVEIPEAIGLNPIGDDRKRQTPRQMIGRWSLQNALPSCAQTFEVETAQIHDLVLNGVLVVTRPLRRSSCIASGRLLHAIHNPGRSLAVLDATRPLVESETRFKPSFVRTTSAESRAPNAAAIPWPS
jgi:hypothetical protein